MTALFRLNFKRCWPGVTVQAVDYGLTVYLVTMGLGHEGNPALAGLTGSAAGLVVLGLVKLSSPLVLYPRLKSWQQKAVTLGMTAVCLFNVWGLLVTA